MPWLHISSILQLYRAQENTQQVVPFMCTVSLCDRICALRMLSPLPASASVSRRQCYSIHIMYTYMILRLYIRNMQVLNTAAVLVLPILI